MVRLTLELISDNTNRAMEFYKEKVKEERDINKIKKFKELIASCEIQLAELKRWNY